MQITILRNNQQFGPYHLDTIKTYVEQGKILMQDKAFAIPHENDIKTVGHFLRQSNYKVRVPHEGEILTQLKAIGGNIIFPNSIFCKKELFKDKKLLILSMIGLAPAFLIRFTFSSFFTFYAIALYFSIIWGLFFYYLFQTKQVRTKNSILIFFLTQLFVWLFIRIQNFPVMSMFYSLTNSSFVPFRMVGFILGVGLLEESIKLLPLFFIARNSTEPLIPQTLVFYGLISGIGFGVFEGVQYQTTINAELSYNEAFFMNVARLTSLPFLHAIWTGIAGYFISFANLYPRYRKSLYLLAIAIPALLHGLYDTFGWSLLGLFITFIGVVMLMAYLKKGSDLQSRLSH